MLAGVLAAVTAPVHWLTLERRWPPAPPSAPEDEPPAALRAVLLSRRF
ncbi:hypothetical protein [Microbacterium sp. MEC084]|nr:hypothetical protein [Microbacterium sp. MEC084]